MAGLTLFALTRAAQARYGGPEPEPGWPSLPYACGPKPAP
jgi:hypothetical protein